MSTHGDIKIVFTGPMGVGKTTAIRGLSERHTLSTEVPISDGVGAADAKRLAAAGFDYGECRLDERSMLRLFGTPGQERLRSLWPVLGAGAFGLVVLVDNSRPDPIGDAERYLRAFATQVPQRRTVLGVGRTDACPHPDVEAYCERLARHGWQVPVIEADVRREADTRMLLSVLISMAEVDDEA